MESRKGMEGRNQRTKEKGREKRREKRTVSPE